MISALPTRPLTGNGSILVKVESLANTNAWAKAGVMIRQSLDADSKFVYFIVSSGPAASPWAGGSWRRAPAAACPRPQGVAAPQWVKLTRTGDAFTAQYSADGKTWTDLKAADGTVASTTVAMTDPVYVGLCVTSHNAAATTTATMSGVTATGTVGGSWQVATIGDDPQPANDPADLYVTVQDSAGKTATATNPTAVVSGEWTQWKIPLSSFAGVNTAKRQEADHRRGQQDQPGPGRRRHALHRRHRLRPPRPISPDPSSRQYHGARLHQGTGPAYLGIMTLPRRDLALAGE